MRTVVWLLGEIVVDINELIVPMLLAGSEMCGIEAYCCVPIRLVPFAHGRGRWRGVFCRRRSGLPARTRSHASFKRT